MIRQATIYDALELTDIYNYHVLNSIATFQLQEVTFGEFESKIASSSDQYPFLVYQGKEGIKGYAYAGLWNTREAYEKTVEASVYLHHEAQGKGIGSQLYRRLHTLLRAQGFHTVIGGISLPNPASVALHEKLGYRKVAHFKEVGFKFNQWVDVGYWQLMIKNDDDI